MGYKVIAEIGLDSYHLHCGSRHPAEYCGVAANQSKTLVDDAALTVLYSEAEASSTSIALVQ